MADIIALIVIAAIVAAAVAYMVKAKNDFYGVYSYYFLDEDGLIKVYCPYRDEIEDSPNSGLASYVLRAFSTVEFVE